MNTIEWLEFLRIPYEQISETEVLISVKVVEAIKIFAGGEKVECLAHVEDVLNLKSIQNYRDKNDYIIAKIMPTKCKLPIPKYIH